MKSSQCSPIDQSGGGGGLGRGAHGEAPWSVKGRGAANKIMITGFLIPWCPTLSPHVHLTWSSKVRCEMPCLWDVAHKICHSLKRVALSVILRRWQISPYHLIDMVTLARECLGWETLIGLPGNIGLTNEKHYLEAVWEEL